MKRPRPYIPLAVRVEVALRQIKQVAEPPMRFGRSDKDYLVVLLCLLFAVEPCHLDHDPPLRVRRFNKRTGKYTPDANDPNHLFYRTKDDHGIKTNVRGLRGQHPDRVLIKRERRREKPKKKRPHKWASRPFPKGRGFQQRARRV